MKNRSFGIKNSLFLLHLFLPLILSVADVHAQGLGAEVVEVSLLGQSDKQGASARQDIFDKTVEQASLQYIQEIIGEQKTQKNLSLIRNKVIKQSGKYVLTMRSQPMAATAKGASQLQVTMRISLKNLEALLLEEGLLYRIDGAPKILPVVAFIDRVNSQSFLWWSQGQQSEKSFLASQSNLLNQKIREQSRSPGFFGLNPVQSQFANLIPSVYQAESLPTEDIQFLGEYFKSQIVVRGHVMLSRHTDRSDVFKMDIKLSALHAGNGRIIGEVIRSYETDPGVFSQVVQAKGQQIYDRVAADLTNQILDSWKSGTFGANLLQLTLRGDLNYNQLIDIKKQLLTGFKSIKTLKERKFEGDRVVFEMDAEANSSQLGEAIQKAKFSRFKVEVGDVKSSGLELRVKSL